MTYCNISFKIGFREGLEMQTFGDRLRALRKGKQLSQHQLAEHLGLDQSTISYYEQDKKVPEIKTLENIAAFFDVSLDELWVSGTSYASPNFVQDIGRVVREVTGPYITPKDLKEKFKLVVDGREATEEEIEEAIRYILIQRLMREGIEPKDI